MTDFVHLNVHSEYSIEDSVIHLNQLVPEVKQRGMSAVALTDRNRLTAMLKFQSECIGEGVKPIIGCELSTATENGAASASVLCADQVGYHNLLRLVTAASRNTVDHGRVTVPMLEEFQRGLIFLTSGVKGHVGQTLLQHGPDDAAQLLDTYLQIFGDRLYVSISRTGRLQENDYIECMVDIADRKDVPLVATNDVICLTAEDFSIHDAKLCILRQESMDDEYSWQGEFSEHQHLKSPEEMAELFADLPDAVENTVELAKRCNVEVETGTYFQRPYPNEDMDENAAILRERATAELEAFLEDANNHVDESSWAEYRSRLDEELEVIIDMGFASYFLIVQKIVLWAKSQDIPVGPGRGSGAASLVARVLGITGVDPIKHKLFFERLLNRDRRSMPDLDIDFCAEQRAKVMWHVVEEFSRASVGLIATTNTHAAKGALHGMGRAMGIPFTDMRKISKLIPTKVGTKLAKACEADPEIERTAMTLGNASLIPQTLRLEGTVSNSGIHPAGVVIAPGPLEEYVPCYSDNDTGLLVSHLDKDDVEKAGLVKFDLLSLKYLTVIDRTLKSINAGIDETAQPLTAAAIPPEDAKTFELIKSAETEGIFQLESDGMKNLIRKLKPDQIADIVALIALFRPGPLQAGTDDRYARRKNKLESVTITHELLEPELTDTYGLMIYQEDVMRVSRSLAGFSGSEADVLREAMGKKRTAVLEQLKDRFLEGCQSNGVPRGLAEGTFNDMLGFSEYAFARAHATAYAMVTYQTSYLKAHYPKEYMAASISVERDAPPRLIRILAEADRMGLVIEPPDVNRPSVNCEPTAQGVRLGLLCLKGWKDQDDVKVLNELISMNGEFTSFFDFCMRVPPDRINRNKVANLILSGGFDKLESKLGNKFVVRSILHDKLDLTYQASTEMSTANGGLFDDPNEDDVFGNYTPPARFTEKELVAGEMDAIGYAPSGNAFGRYEKEFQPICTHTLNELQQLSKGQDVVVGGVITRAETRDGQRGEFANIDLKSTHGDIRVVVWPEAFEKYSRFVIEDQFVVITGRTDNYQNQPQIAAERIFNVEGARKEFQARICLRFDERTKRERLTEDNLTRFKAVFENTNRKQGRPVDILVEKDSAKLHVELGTGFRKLNVTDEVLAELNDIFGAGVVHVGHRSNK